MFNTPKFLECLNCYLVLVGFVYFAWYIGQSGILF